ncbi:MAG: hypothetical protein ABFS45_21405 [Pseudomonadota bacterium]
MTLDQIELAVLNGKHGFLRAAALARHVVIIDEIHAYDAYMNKPLDSALPFLARHRTPVILLPATLPQHIRTRCLLAGRGKTLSALETVRYPRIRLSFDTTTASIYPRTSSLAYIKTKVS